MRITVSNPLSYLQSVAANNIMIIIKSKVKSGCFINSA